MIANLDMPKAKKLADDVGNLMKPLKVIFKNLTKNIAN